VRPRGARSPLGIKFLCYQWAVIAFSDYLRQMFRKNSMEFFIELSYYFILLYKWLYPIVTSLSRMFYGHMICSLKFPCYLYLDPIVCFDVVDQMFKCAGNYFLLGALITTISLGMIGY